MTTYTAQCEIDASDTVTASRTSGRIELESVGARDIYLGTDKARTFARGILALADEIDGGEAEEPANPRPKVGDRLRVTEDHPRHAPVVRGDVITVAATDYDHNGADYVRFKHADDDYLWFVPLTAVELVDDEPAPEPALADWERDLLEGSAPARSSRAKYVEDARRLMDGTGADADHIIAVAQFLAADE